MFFLQSTGCYIHHNILVLLHMISSQINDKHLNFGIVTPSLSCDGCFKICCYFCYQLLCWDSFVMVFVFQMYRIFYKWEDLNLVTWV